MKLFSLLSIILFSTTLLNAQVETELRIYHKLGAQEFQMNSTTTNNTAQDFQVTRLSYYMSEFTVVHDGGQQTIINVDTVAIIHADAVGGFTTVQLGNLNVTSVEAIKFHIGVRSPINTSDPGLFSTPHPLAPQSPSMHWGWSAGYRFVAYEGVGGSGFSQMFQMHGLWDANYYETTVTAAGQVVGSTMYIAIEGDYSRGMDNIDVAAGVIAHGVNQEDLTLLQNFRDVVYSASSATITANLEDVSFNGNWSVYPNPTKGEFSLDIDSDINVNRVSVINLLGHEVVSIDIAIGDSPYISLNNAGVYFVNLMNGSTILSTKRIVKQ